MQPECILLINRNAFWIHAPVRNSIGITDFVQLIEKYIACPYCGENWVVLLDPSGGSADYVEDCAVCCHPIEFQMCVDRDGNITTLLPHREDE